MIDPVEVASRVREIRSAISRLASHDVSIIAVTKTFPVEAWKIARDAGCDAIGENYAQELLSKVTSTPAPLPVHFIGSIQSNKVKSLAPFVDVWEGVDRESVVVEIAKRSPGARILLQVNTTDEVSKSGVLPRDIDNLLSVASTAGLRVDGLMTLGPTDGDPTTTRKAFSLLRKLADERHLHDCSMGMSGDYQIGLECGSTMIRIGSMLFGERAARAL